MDTEERETAHETFNRRFDAMFGEDCRDNDGRLHYVRKGKLGLGRVCSYLSKIDWADNFPLDIVEIKLQRLITELKHLWYVFTLFQLFFLSVLSLSLALLTSLYSGSESSDPTDRIRPSRHTAPTSKLTDSNNSAPPELAFQRKAVQAFHTQRAKELENKSAANGEASSSVNAIDSTPTSAPTGKRNINATTFVESEEDDDQPEPKPCTLLCSYSHLK